MSRRLLTPPTTTRQSILIGTRLIHTIIMIFLSNHLTQIIIQIRCRMRFICSTPNSDRRMVPQASDFVKSIRLECLRLCHIIICHVQPKIIPYHNPIFIAIIIKIIISNTTCPQTNHVVIHFFMQPDFRLILLSLATKQIFAHSPVSSFQINLLSVDEECQNRITNYIINHLILILLNTECQIFHIRYLPVNRTSQFACIKIRIAITIRPPKFRLINNQLCNIILGDR